MRKGDETKTKAAVHAQLPLPPLGQTPLVSFILGFPRGRTVQLSLKLEGHNPLGSIKDRPAVAMLTALETAGELSQDVRVVESSSGNLAVALAGHCRQRGIGFLAVVDPKITSENLSRLRALDAEVEMVQQRDQTGGYLLTRLARVQELIAANPNLRWTDQYHNPENPKAHYESTAPELHSQMGDVEAIFVPVSTGGTVSGISRYFREHAPDVDVVAVDVLGSMAIGGSEPHERHLPGIGAGKHSHFLNERHYSGVAANPHDVAMVPESQAVATCIWLAQAADLRVGASSGATVAGCLGWLRDHPEVKHVACVCADLGANYKSTVYDETWRAHWGFTAEPAPAVCILSIDGKGVTVD